MASLYEQLIPQIEQLKDQLNLAKNQLNVPEFEKLKKEDSFARKIREIRKELTKKANAQNLTQGGLKILEILERTPLGEFLLKLPKIRAFFNAELPGSFLFSVSHYLRTHGKELDWVLASYLPQESPEGTVYLDDIFGLIPANPGRILVGEINTNLGTFWSSGDLTHPRIPEILAQLSGPVDFYTADGGIDVSGKESQQEELMIPLIRGEIETGFRVLKVGGALVLKIFTFFTPEMLALLLLLIRSFETYQLFKPSTSNPINSEVYFVGIGYYGPQFLDFIRKDPKSILIGNLTQKEAEYFWTHLVSFSINQISNIQKFLNREALPAPLTPTLSPLDPRDRIPTFN